MLVEALQRRGELSPNPHLAESRYCRPRQRTSVKANKYADIVKVSRQFSRMRNAEEVR